MSDDLRDIDARIWRQTHGSWPHGYTPATADSNGEPEPPPHPAETAADDVTTPCLDEPVDWAALFARQPAEHDWLVEGWWPTGRHVHVHASRKVGKSLLSLWTAFSIATGSDPFTGRRVAPQHISYFDYEMSEDDLLDRLEDMEAAPDKLDRLHYYLLPSLPPLDTAAGGTALLAHLDRDQSVAAVVDTLGRAVNGDENEADTYRAWWTHTGSALKRSGRGLLRLDHEGHQAGRSRGSSAKADDVDLVYGMTLVDGGLRLERKHSRIRGTDAATDLAKLEDPLRFRRVSESWPAGTAELAALLDQAAVPLTAGKGPARQMLKDAGLSKGNNEVLLKALLWRRRQAETGLR